MRTLTPRIQLLIVISISAACYFPFVNQALHIDSDMMVTVARQIAVNPVNPPLGDYGRHMVLHDHTLMPQSSVYYRSHHPPLIAALLAPVALMAGTAEWPFHAFCYLFYLLCVLGGWSLFGLFLEPRERFRAALLWTVCPALMVNSHGIMWDVPIAGIMLWALVLFIRALRTGRIALLVACAVVTGLAGVAKVNSISIFVLFAAALVLKKKWTWLLVWSSIAAALPVAWIVHNLIVFGKIQYLSSGQTSFLLGDMRYRIERIVSFMGGCVVVPAMLYWLVVRIRKLRLTIIPFAVFAVGWSLLLQIALHKTVWYAVGYGVCSCVGFWFFVETFVPTAPGADERRDERNLLIAYAALCALVLVFLPSASVRYMLPLIPIAVIAFANLARLLPEVEQRWFWRITLALTIPLALALSLSDYLFCESDRRLPAALAAHGYPPGHTWYYGRLSFDYYLHQAGYRNGMIDHGKPETGDFAVEERIPGEYGLSSFLPRTAALAPVDSISFFHFALRTKGLFAGFYGNDRLPYSLSFASPQKQFVVYRIENPGL